MLEISNLQNLTMIQKLNIISQLDVDLAGVGEAEGVEDGAGLHGGEGAAGLLGKGCQLWELLHQHLQLAPGMVGANVGEILQGQFGAAVATASCTHIGYIING